jgi:integrase/recombinase XerD
MKSQYPRYGRKTAQLGALLTEEDQTILQEFLDYCAMNASYRRVQHKYKGAILQFRDVVEKPLNEVTPHDAIRFWGLVNESSYEERTKIDIKRAVKRFLKHRFKNFELLESLKIPKQRVNPHRLNKNVLFTDDELKLMLHRAESLRDKALFILLYETAGRPQEVHDLRWRDVNWVEEEVRFYSTKTESDRSLPIREALKHLRRWFEEWILPDPKQDDFVFPATIGAFCDRKKGLSVTYINRIIKRLAKKAGLTRHVTTYLLRHTRLTELHRKQVQGREWKLFAGHTADSKMEATYIHLNNDDMKESVISKVYGTKELPKVQKQQYEDRILVLENQSQQIQGQIVRSS